MERLIKEAEDLEMCIRDRSTHLCKTVYQLLSGGIGVDLPLREVSDDDFCAS